MEEINVIKALAALAQAFRLRVFRELVVAGLQGSTPSALSEALSIPSTTLSFHLKELMYAGLVSQEREGRSLIYRANLSAMTGLMQYLTDNCCQGKGCGPINKVSKLSRKT